MEKFSFKPTGVCAKNFEITVEGTKISEFTSEGGCPGNLIGLSNAIKGMEYKEVIEKFENVICGKRSTSCPMQLAKALKEHFI